MLVTTGKEKTRLSCLMTATASGCKLPTLCVVPRKKKIQALEENLNEMIIIYETKGLIFKIFLKKSLIFIKNKF